MRWVGADQGLVGGWWILHAGSFLGGTPGVGVVSGYYSIVCHICSFCKIVILNGLRLNSSF